MESDLEEWRVIAAADRLIWWNGERSGSMEIDLEEWRVIVWNEE
jgi:hypothetical protein